MPCLLNRFILFQYDSGIPVHDETRIPSRGPTRSSYAQDEKGLDIKLKEFILDYKDDLDKRVFSNDCKQVIGTTRSLLSFKRLAASLKKYGVANAVIVEFEEFLGAAKAVHDHVGDASFDLVVRQEFTLLLHLLDEFAKVQNFF